MGPSWWCSRNTCWAGFPFPVRALSKVFRGKFLAGLRQLRARHLLDFAGDSATYGLSLFAVARPGAELPTSRIIDHLRARVAKHMVPEHVRLMDVLPLNANGKVVKAELRAMLALPHSADAAPVAATPVAAPA